MKKYPKGIVIQRKEVKEDCIEFDPNDLIEYTHKDAISRRGGEFKGNALYLPEDYGWAIVRDSNNLLCLVPTKKEE